MVNLSTFSKEGQPPPPQEIDNWPLYETNDHRGPTGLCWRPLLMTSTQIGQIIDVGIPLPVVTLVLNRVRELIEAHFR